MNMTHTTIETRDGWTRMVYHGTCVAEKRETRYLDPRDPRAGTFVRLNTGGYFTKTTKRRMNQFAEMFNLGFRVMQEKGLFSVSVNTSGKTSDGVSFGVATLLFNGTQCEFTVGV